ncbi:MAG: hypothetical protein ACRDNK_16145 [Solirubrobacteraceae bacterium]
MPDRAAIDLGIALDGDLVVSETTCTWAGAHVLTLHTVIPQAELALELHSTFVGCPGSPTHAVHLQLGPPGHSPAVQASDHDGDRLDPTLVPRGCVYEHAQRLIELLADLGYRAAVTVAGDSAFKALERVGSHSS